MRRKAARILASVAAAAMVFTAATAVPAGAAPPGTPTLVRPADGTTAAEVDPVLAVTPTDPDGGNVTVRFEGRRRGATVPGTSTAAPFTFVVIPDTQNYTYLARDWSSTLKLSGSPTPARS